MGGGGEKKRNADEEEKGRVLKTVLHLFKVYVFLFQKFFNHFIPRMLQCFIHGKCLERCPGNTGQAGAVKMDVQVEPLYAVRIQSRGTLRDKAPDIFVRRAENESKT